MKTDGMTSLHIQSFDGSRSLVMPAWVLGLALFLLIPKPLTGWQADGPQKDDRQIINSSSGIFTTRANPVLLPLPENEETFQFVIYGDRTGGKPAGLKVLQQAVNDTKLIDPDFVLTVGDLIQGYNRPPQWLREMREFRGIMNDLSMPWFPVAGNHDIYWDSGDADRPRVHHENNYEENFGPLWYSFEHKNTGFIILYSDEGDLETGEKGFNQGRMQNVSPQQMKFLEQALLNFRDKQQVFVALHHPRWIGGGYAGSNWPQVHQMLVEAGNVPAVFAGHIHHMRYDPQDGIDYYSLATTGGGLGAEIPEIGYLHHFNVVTVRPSGYSMATIPVGAVIDPQKFTPGFLEDVGLVRRMRPRRAADALDVKLDGSVTGHYSIAIPNPGKNPLEIAVTPAVNEGWSVVPDHQHIVVPPGRTDGMDFYFYREGSTGNDAWDGYQIPVLKTEVDYLHESARIRLPAFNVPVDVRLAAVPGQLFDEDLNECLTINTTGNNRTGCARIHSSDFELPQGPFTLEAWVNPSSIAGTQAVVAKTQSSEFAIFLKEGVPQFDVHFGQRYVTATASEALPVNQWTHLAGIYDGRSVQLFVNGRLVSSEDGAGPRTRNDLPLLIGADPDGKGKPTRHFAGSLDEVRLSRMVRYTDTFSPPRRFQSDGGCVLLLHLDRSAGPYLLDDSRPAAFIQKLGNASIQPCSK